MPHINTGPGEHDPTTTLYVVRLDADEPRALLHKHRKLGVLLPVGGHIELVQSPWSAAHDELHQESGYKMSQMKVLQPTPRIHMMPNATMHPYPIICNTHPVGSDHFHSDTAYALVTDEKPQDLPEEGETSELQWFTKSELQTIVKGLVYEDTRQVYEFIFDVALHQWDAVDIDGFAV